MLTQIQNLLPIILKYFNINLFNIYQLLTSHESSAFLKLKVKINFQGEFPLKYQIQKI